MIRGSIRCLLGAVLVALSACGGGTGTGGGEDGGPLWDALDVLEGCTPGEVGVCTCPDGTGQGTETCGPDGEFGTCQGCPEPEDPCAGVTCGGHGACKLLDGEARCVCEPGYVEVGLDCFPEGCEADCNGRFCGPDGCGGTCGTCDPGQDCSPDGLCLCAPDCEGMECGDDGCGGDCGPCPQGLSCEDGVCVACTPDCLGKDCGPDSCGGQCGACGDGESCNAQGLCVELCQPQCDGKDCGPDGCGGQCGDCGDGESCDAQGLCVEACQPQCGGKECGPDGCGGQCGDCAGGETCSMGQCIPMTGGCFGACGDESPEGCYCDEICFDSGDCCTNVCDACPDLSGCGGGGDCNPGCPANWIGDGLCDVECNVPACDNDGGDCGGGGECNPGCPANWIGDGICDAECNVPACDNDDGDCGGGGDCNPGCPEYWIGDGFCDTACNVPACNNDDGDCGGGSGSCVGFCNGSAGGCYCDDACFSFGDCCTDVCDACPYLTGCGGGGDCNPGCPVYWIGDGFCDAACNVPACDNDGGDCGGGGFGSCQGVCGGSSDGCYCDEACFGYGDCCDDVCTACPALPSCGGAGDGTCLDVYACQTACPPGDQACADACLATGTLEAQGLLLELMSCLQGTGYPDCPEGDQGCLDAALALCPDEVQACLVGDLTCEEILSCQDVCPGADPGCPALCYWQGSLASQDQLDALEACVDEACASNPAPECIPLAWDGPCLLQAQVCGHVPSCVPACADKLCGDDGCGGSCGSCAPGEACEAGACVAASLDLSGWSLVKTPTSGAPATLVLPAGTALPPGGRLVLARKAAQADFEAYWGAPLPAGTLYLDTDDALVVVVNGNNQFTLLDAGGVPVDGPTVQFAASTNASRLVPPAAAADPASWLLSDAAVKTNATPGSGPADSTGFQGVYISEVADAVGTGMYVYEFIELHHDPAP